MIDIAMRNNDFIEAEQYVHQAIASKSKATKSLWRNMIPTGTFEYGRGYMMKKHAFSGGKEITDAAGDWYQLKGPKDRANSNNAAEDACQYDPQVVGYGFEEKQYTIYETTRRTEDVCLRDLVFNWQFEAQMTMIMNSLSDITLGAWEKWLRETYVTFATKLLVAEGMPSFTITGSVNASGVLQSAGLREINLGGTPANKIGLLTQPVLDNIYSYLARQCSDARVADGPNSMPVFPIVTSFETSTEMITRDERRRNDQRYARPTFLLEGYGSVSGYQNWAHYHDIETPRYKLSLDGTKLERVYPYEFTPSTIGEMTNISKDYVNAPFEMSIVFLKDVFRGLVPENPGNVAGATFGGASNLGTFKWINIPNKETNLLGEIGFMFARFNCAPEPLDQVDNALVLVHRRHQAIPIVLPDQSIDDEGASDAALDILSVAKVVTPDDTSDVKYQEIEVLLNGVSNLTIGDTASILSTTLTPAETVRVTRDYTNGRYRVMFDSEADWAAILVADANGTFNNA